MIKPLNDSLETVDLCIMARDPVVARDGRPFSNSQRRMRPLPWIYPSVIAGAVRTLLGKQLGGFRPAIQEKLQRIRFWGPFPEVDNELYFPAPSDLLVREREGSRECFAL